MRLLNLNTAIYCRLSREDGNEESQSIQSQKEILTEYVKKQGWNLVDYYIDDGYSGTDFNRPSFQRLLRDIELGKIGIVITKDLSRLGRNYIQAGYYTEEYFPLHNIRYIALNDAYDTFNEDANDFAPFKNIINEWYAKDISKKIRFTLDNKAKNGEPRNTVFPIFGYKYNESFERIPDPETAPIVKFIFEEYVRTGSSNQVAKALKSKKVKLPCYYNAMKYNYNRKKVLQMTEEQLISWTPTGVRDILEKDDYIGTYVTARTKATSYKLKKRNINSEAYVFKNRYEPLIDTDTFERAQKILKRTRSGEIPMEENIYKGLVLCGDCGFPMKYERKRDRKTNELSYYRYFCKKKECGYANTIQKKHLNEIVKNDLLFLKDTILLHKEEFIAFAKSFDSTGRVVELNIDVDIKKYQSKNDEIDMYLMKLFEQHAKGNLPQSTYELMLNQYKKQKKFIDEQLKELMKQKTEQLVQATQEEKLNDFIDMLTKINEENVLDTDMIHSVIGSIIVTSRKIPNYQKKYEFKIDIQYSVLDSIIKEFMKTHEKNSSNLCQTIS